MAMRQPPEADMPDVEGAADDTVPMGGSEPVPATPVEAGAVARDLHVTKLTDVGRVRSHNEDFVDYFCPQDPETRQRKGVLCIVADGMGGHQAGEVASEEAVRLVIDQYYRDMNPDVGKSLVKAIKAANRSVFEQAQADAAKAGMGTTLVAAAILDHKVYVANVGDSRAYIVGAGGTSQITEDHSWVEEQVRAGLLTPEQAQRHPQRNLVTRALGTRPSVEVDLFEGTMGEDDVLLLCSDGLTNHVQDRDLESAVATHPPEAAASELIELAKERGGSDNITVLIVTAEGGMEQAVPVAAAPRVQKAAVLVLAALAALLVVVIVGLLVVRPLLESDTGTATATPTEVTPQALPSATVVEAATPVPSSTASQTAPAEPTLPITATQDAASGGGTEEPTATLRPTDAPTLTPSPTPTPTASATATASPTPSSTTMLTKPSLRKPLETDARSLQGQVQFVWTYPSGLDTGQAFQVLIWPVGTADPLGAAEPIANTQQTIDLDLLLRERGGPGEYKWSVVVVKNSAPETRLSRVADPWIFNYIGERGSRPRPPSSPSPTFGVPSLPTIAPLPTATP